MKCKTIIATCALSAVLALGAVGCSSNGGSSQEIISGGYLPNEITEIENGGEFDGASLAPHDSGEYPLEKLEGQWVYEGLADGSDSAGSDNGNSYTVTDKTITLNEDRIECLPKGIDIRPYSPVKALISEGFGYGAAIFPDAPESDESGIGIIEFNSMLPYAGNGFICTTDGNTLALGFLNDGAKMDDYGLITDDEYTSLTDNIDDHVLDECELTEIDYEVSLDGNKLTLSYGGASATYVQETGLFSFHSSSWLSGEPLYEGDTMVKALGSSPKDLSNKGYKFDCDLNEILPSRGVSEEVAVKTPGGSKLTAKIANPYEKSVPLGYSKVCWYEYAGDKSGNLTVNKPSQYDWSHFSQEFGVTPYSDVYNNYELPYEASLDYLCYKSGYALASISIITGLGDGYDTGDTVIESERSYDMRLEFEDNVLSSISVSDPAYLNAGLQDNIAHDDLDDLKPSVYREATEKRDQILDELNKAFKAAGVNAAINEKTGEVVMDNGVLFASDSYELGGSGEAYLDKVFSAYASVVLDDRFAPALKEVSFEGNTDSDGDSEYNMRLSDNRARAVMEYCAGLLDGEQAGVFSELAVCRGYGESDLVYDERGNEDKDASRRVAIKFLMKVDGSASDAGSQSDGKSSGSASSSDGATEPLDELDEFRAISGKFDQAWSLYEASEDGGAERAVALLLSDDHRYCAYVAIEQGASGVTGAYTFGETSIEKTAQNNETITVRSGDDSDELDVVFGAWGKDDTVSVKDFEGGVYDLTALDDVDVAISLFEDVLDG